MKISGIRNENTENKRWKYSMRQDFSLIARISKKSSNLKACFQNFSNIKIYHFAHFKN